MNNENETKQVKNSNLTNTSPLFASKFFKQKITRKEINLPKKIEEFSRKVDMISLNITGEDYVLGKHIHSQRRKYLNDKNQRAQFLARQATLKRAERQMTFHGEMIKRLLQNDNSKHIIIKEYLKGRIDDYTGSPKRKTKLTRGASIEASSDFSLDRSNSKAQKDFFLTNSPGDTSRRKNLSRNLITLKGFNKTKEKASSYSINKWHSHTNNNSLSGVNNIGSNFNIINSKGSKSFKGFKGKIFNHLSNPKNQMKNNKNMQKSEFFKTSNTTNYNSTLGNTYTNTYATTLNTDTYYQTADNMKITENYENYENKFTEEENDNIINTTMSKLDIQINEEDETNQEEYLENMIMPSQPEPEAVQPKIKQKFNKAENKKKMFNIINICRNQSKEDKQHYQVLEKEIERINPVLPYRQKLPKEKVEEDDVIRPQNHAKKYFIYGKDKGVFMCEDTGAEDLIAQSNRLGKILSTGVYKFRDVIAGKMGLQVSQDKNGLSLNRVRQLTVDELKKIRNENFKKKQKIVYDTLDEIEKVNIKLINSINHVLRK